MEEGVVALAHPVWQYVVVFGALAFIAWCLWLVETD